MSLPAFSVTYDYRCPFARNAHEHIVAALQAGAAWDVTFLPFSLTQAHVEEGGTAVWDNPDKAADLLALEASVVVRDRFPDQFLAAHWALFSARHDQAGDLRDEAVVRAALTGAGVDADAVFAALSDGGATKEVRRAHEFAAGDLRVFGVPTFIVGDRAVFVRLMSRPAGDAALAEETIEHVVSLIDGHPALNEFKYTTVKF
jgi:predicted DsbA family dithiol-disulfide isomerase